MHELNTIKLKAWSPSSKQYFNPLLHVRKCFFFFFGYQQIKFEYCCQRELNSTGGSGFKSLSQHLIKYICKKKNLNIVFMDVWVDIPYNQFKTYLAFGYEIFKIESFALKIVLNLCVI